MAAQEAVETAAVAEGLPSEVESAFEPPLLLLPFRESELPPELKAATQALVHCNMSAVYEASGWSAESEAPSESEALYLLLFEQPSEGGEDGDGDALEDEDDSSEDRMMKALVKSMLGFAAVEFSVEGGEPALYLVELQLALRARRKGLGSRLTAATVRPASSSSAFCCRGPVVFQQRRPSPPLRSD